ncbi:MAG TPA: RraA family protein [Terriglobia bacterium]|nr:RraA family protein [Terriglobia bacterium]
MHETNSGPSLIEYLKTIDTPTISNAIELLHLRPKSEGFTPLQVRCLFPDFGPMCGYAVTAQVETMTEGNPREEAGYVGLFEAVEKSPHPAVIAFQEIGGHPDYAVHCGEVMATFFTRFGGIGMVTDAAVRDLAEVKALRFHYFARGAAASHANFRIVRVGVPITVMGLVIRPQDILHGDQNGLIQIPKEAAEGLPGAIESVRTKERRLMDLTKDPGFTASQLHGRFFH